MAQVDSENSTAMPAGDAGTVIPDGLAQQQRQREKALKRLANLRTKASAEIERLIDFMDASDPYAATELEDAVDDGPCDDDERELGEGDDEPSLGSHVMPSGAVSYSIPVSRNGDHDCEGDEHDGREPEDEGGDGAKEDDEPTLGWTVDGAISNTSGEGDDAELHGSAPRDIVETKRSRKVSRTELRWLDGAPVTAENLRTRPSNVINVDSKVL